VRFLYDLRIKTYDTLSQINNQAISLTFTKAML